MFNLPSFITIGQAIDFHSQYGSLLEDGLNEINALDEGLEKEFEMMEFEIGTALWMISFLTGESIDGIKETHTINDILNVYHNQIAALFNPEVEFAQSLDWGNKTWLLPAVELKPGSTVTFGEFIDSKVMSQDVIDGKGSKWEMILYIAVIFMRKESESYSPTFLYEASERINLFKQLPLNIAANAGKWIESFTEYLQEYFPVFSESQIRSGSHVSAHMGNWGWINFLKSVATTKVFDIANSGMNSIDCARAAKAYDVLVSASEEKQYNEAVSLDMELAYKK